jgi:ESS family glutamate:Na+ symporter
VTKVILPVDSVLVLGFGAVAITAGNVLQARIGILRRWLIPPPIVAGLVLALPTVLLRSRGYVLEVEPTLQQIAMVALFTSIGFNIDREGLRRGRRPVLVFLTMVGVGAVVQNLVGIVMARIQGLHALLGIATGAVALTGGPATALAFGPGLEQAGAPGATSIAVASAICGILVAGALSAAFGAFLIERDELKPVPESTPERSDPTRAPEPFHATQFLRSLVVFGVTMGLGRVLNSALNDQLRSWSISVPAYVGSMLVACSLTLLTPKGRAALIPPQWNEAFGTAALTWFIPLALWTLRYWELTELALSIPLMIAVQLPFTLAIAWLAYRLAGRNYDSAVMATGFFGFMFGTMANSLAAMNELCRRFGHSRQAYLVIPIIGGVLSDVVNVLVIGLSRVFATH